MAMHTKPGAQRATSGLMARFRHAWEHWILNSPAAEQHSFSLKQDHAKDKDNYNNEDERQAAIVNYMDQLSDAVLKHQGKDAYTPVERSIAGDYFDTQIVMMKRTHRPFNINQLSKKPNARDRQREEQKEMDARGPLGPPSSSKKPDARSRQREQKEAEEKGPPSPPSNSNKRKPSARDRQREQQEAEMRNLLPPVSRKPDARSRQREQEDAEMRHLPPPVSRKPDARSRQREQEEAEREAERRYLLPPVSRKPDARSRQREQEDAEMRYLPPPVPRKPDARSRQRQPAPPYRPDIKPSARSRGQKHRREEEEAKMEAPPGYYQPKPNARKRQKEAAQNNSDIVYPDENEDMDNDENMAEEEAKLVAPPAPEMMPPTYRKGTKPDARSRGRARAREQEEALQGGPPGYMNDEEEEVKAPAYRPGRKPDARSRGRARAREREESLQEGPPGYMDNEEVKDRDPGYDAPPFAPTDVLPVHLPRDHSDSMQLPNADIHPHEEKGPPPPPEYSVPEPIMESSESKQDANEPTLVPVTQPIPLPKRGPKIGLPPVPTGNVAHKRGEDYEHYERQKKASRRDPLQDDRDINPSRKNWVVKRAAKKSLGGVTLVERPDQWHPPENFTFPSNPNPNSNPPPPPPEYTNNNARSKIPYKANARRRAKLGRNNFSGLGPHQVPAMQVNEENNGPPQYTDSDNDEYEQKVYELPPPNYFSNVRAPLVIQLDEDEKKPSTTALTSTTSRTLVSADPGNNNKSARVANMYARTNPIAPNNEFNATSSTQISHLSRPFETSAITSVLPVRVNNNERIRELALNDQTDTISAASGQRAAHVDVVPLTIPKHNNSNRKGMPPQNPSSVFDPSANSSLMSQLWRSLGSGKATPTVAPLPPFSDALSANSSGVPLSKAPFTLKRIIPTAATSGTIAGDVNQIARHNPAPQFTGQSPPETQTNYPKPPLLRSDPTPIPTSNSGPTQPRASLPKHYTGQQRNLSLKLKLKQPKLRKAATLKVKLRKVKALTPKKKQTATVVSKAATRINAPKSLLDAAWGFSRRQQLVR